MSTKPITDTEHFGVQITPEPALKIKHARRKKEKKVRPICTGTQFQQNVEVILGDHKKNALAVNVPITREGALLGNYLVACALKDTAEKWIVQTITDMQNRGQLPSAAEMKEMVGVVKGIQDVMNNTWSKAEQQNVNRKEAGMGVHSPILNQFFKVETLINTADGKVPQFNEVLKEMHEFKVKSSALNRKLDNKEVKQITDDLSNAVIIEDHGIDGMFKEAHKAINENNKPGRH